MKYILFAILIYVAYQFIFKLLIPVVRTTQKIKKGFREMHDQMTAEKGVKTKASAEPASSSKPLGDYIDFEEVK